MTKGARWRSAYEHSEQATPYLWLLAIVGVVLAVAAKRSDATRLHNFVRASGVAAKRVRRSVLEIERKTFHIAGVLIPVWYQTMTDWANFSELWCAQFACGVTACVWAAELSRLYSPTVRRLFEASPLGRIMREHEREQLTGTAYFTLGCTLTIVLFPRDVANVSILYLVLGDMTAALVGVSFGGDAVVVKLGREGKKSVEGSLGMFLVCFIVGYTYFWNFHLCEYVAFVSAAAATLTELWSEDHLELNDNVTIPIVTSFAISWAFARIADCTTS